MKVSATADEGLRLLARIQCGDGSALTQLYDVWAHRVYCIALHLLRDTAAAEEAVERTFSQIWRDADRFDPARGSVSAWIVVIARAQALSGPRGKLHRARQYGRREQRAGGAHQPNLEI
jgi:RNA polymerase sigma-70 factor (ECF subfamily)